MENKDNVIVKKSVEFAINILQATNILNQEKAYVVAKQLIRSGTSIGANVTEAQQAESTKDFIHKLSIALKEATETMYWLIIIKKSKICTQLTDKSWDTLLEKASELKRILTKIIKTSKEKLKNEK